MTMASKIEYMVSKDTLGSDFCIPISKDNFDNSKKSQKILSTALELEIRYEMILSNYTAMEKGLFSILVDKSMFIPQNLQYEIYDDRTKNKIQVNTLLSNLLTVAISYQGHVEKNIRKLFRMTKEQIEEIFDKPGYKFIKELRNYQQHQNVVESVVLPKLETFEDGSQRILANVPCYVDWLKDRNDKDENINSLLLIPPDPQPELGEGQGNQLDMCHIIRFCMDLHNDIHREISGIINSKVQEARDYIEEFIDDCISRAKEKYPNIQDEEDLKIGLIAYAYTWETQDISIPDRIQLFPGLGHIRDKLNKKNQEKLDLLKLKYWI